jgi:hypothetical protein
MPPRTPLKTMAAAARLPKISTAPAPVARFPAIPLPRRGARAAIPTAPPLLPPHHASASPPHRSLSAPPPEDRGLGEPDRSLGDCRRTGASAVALALTSSSLGFRAPAAQLRRRVCGCAARQRAVVDRRHPPRVAHDHEGDRDQQRDGRQQREHDDRARVGVRCRCGRSGAGRRLCRGCFLLSFGQFAERVSAAHRGMGRGRNSDRNQRDRGDRTKTSRKAATEKHRAMAARHAASIAADRRRIEALCLLCDVVRGSGAQAARRP